MNAGQIAAALIEGESDEVRRLVHKSGLLPPYHDLNNVRTNHVWRIPEFEHFNTYTGKVISIHFQSRSKWQDADSGYTYNRWWATVVDENRRKEFDKPLAPWADKTAKEPKIILHLGFGGPSGRLWPDVLKSWKPEMDKFVDMISKLIQIDYIQWPFPFGDGYAAVPFKK